MSIFFCGMDVHKESVMVAVLEAEGAEPQRVERLPNELAKLERFFSKLARRGEVRACYEASGAGYVLHRDMTTWGHHCEIVAPSLIPIRPGERRKHDRRDAIQLARMYRAGELVSIRIPSEAEERVRDLVRCRQVFQREILRSRHYILKFLRRRGVVYRQGSHWTLRHRGWLKSLLDDGQLEAQDAIVLAEYLALMEYKVHRRDELDGRIEKLALSPPYKEAVERLRCFRGIKTLTAMVLVTEIGDWRRFNSPSQLMSYLGLIPSEHSSGSNQRRGRITKAGNSYCRHVLVQAAWSYRHRPHLGPALKKRQRGQPPTVISQSWKAQHRLHRLYGRIVFKKVPQVAAVAVAREMVGFLWATMRELDAERSTKVA